MFALYKLQAKAWFSNMFNKMDFIMTLMFLAVMGSMVAFGIQNDGDIPEVLKLDAIMKANLKVIGSVTIMMVASSAINTFGVSFFEMKESVLLKRIGATEISKPMAIGSFILWGMTSMAMIIGWLYLIVGIFQIPGLHEATGGVLYIGGAWADINWVGFFVAIIITTLAFYAVSFFFVSISPNSSSFQIIGTFYFFVATFLGGGFTPNADEAWMDIIGKLTPFGWGMNLMGDSLHGANVFDFGGYSYLINKDTPYEAEVIVKSWEATCQIVVPLVIAVLAAGASAKFFKWDK